MNRVHSLRERYRFLPKDFVLAQLHLSALKKLGVWDEFPREANLSVACAVLDWASGDEPFAVTPRYLQLPEGIQTPRCETAWRKLTTTQALELSAAAGILQHCSWRDVPLPTLRESEIVRHWRPEDGFRNALASDQQVQPLASIMDKWSNQLEAAEGPLLGITGSRLIGAPDPNSDVDIVVYGVEQMQRVRQLIGEGLHSGDIGALDAHQWRATFERRGSSLELEEYVWHEQRKHNKFRSGSVRVDVSCVDQPPASWKMVGRKLALIQSSALVVDASRAFATPAEYIVESDKFSRVISYSATFAGQATEGERIEVRGWLEQLADGTRQLVVGTSREATGQWIRVLANATS